MIGNKAFNGWDGDNGQVGGKLWGGVMKAQCIWAVSSAKECMRQVPKSVEGRRENLRETRNLKIESG